MADKKPTDAERRRKFPKDFKIGFMDHRDAVLAGDSDKDRRNGPDMEQFKSWTSAHEPEGGVNLGEHCALASLHDRFKRFKAHQQTADILNPNRRK